MQPIDSEQRIPTLLVAMSAYTFCFYWTHFTVLKTKILFLFSDMGLEMPDVQNSTFHPTQS